MAIWGELVDIDQRSVLDELKARRPLVAWHVSLAESHDHAVDMDLGDVLVQNP